MKFHLNSKKVEVVSSTYVLASDFINLGYVWFEAWKTYLDETTFLGVTVAQETKPNKSFIVGA